MSAGRMDENSGILSDAINQPDAILLASLFDAIGDGDVEEVKSLLDNGANANGVGRGGSTPLLKATGNRYLNREVSTIQEIVKLLLDHGADPTIADEEGRTPLHEVSVRSARNFQIRKEEDSQKVSDNMQAIQDMATSFIKLGASVNSPDKRSDTPLLEAVSQGSVGLVKMFLENGALVNQAGHNGETPLSIASEERHIEVVKLLKKAIAYIQVKALHELIPGVTVELLKLTVLTTTPWYIKPNDIDISGDLDNYGTTPPQETEFRGSSETCSLITDLEEQAGFADNPAATMDTPPLGGLDDGTTDAVS
ncbi:MAG: hypothetical protein COA94_07900 [Rickettsiales bacterium]|nr:MAG: hypothetical protein COA94_07900 [Rickettsiales bacterium]